MGPGSALAMLACPGRRRHFRSEFQTTDTRPRSRGAISPELCVSLSLERRGSRECRMRAAPAVSCAKWTKKNAHEHTGSAEALRHSLRNGFTAYNVISPENRDLLSPSPANRWLIRARSGRLAFSRDLTPTMRRQDHTTSPYASAPPVRTPRGSLTSKEPALPSRRAHDAAASTASHPNVRDDGQRPFLGDRMPGVKK